jgi:hypothetical protein
MNVVWLPQLWLHPIDQALLPQHVLFLVSLCYLTGDVILLSSNVQGSRPTGTTGTSSWWLPRWPLKPTYLMSSHSLENGVEEPLASHFSEWCAYLVLLISWFYLVSHILNRLCSLVVRVSGYRFRGLGFDSEPYQIFWEVGGLEQGPLSLMRTIEELLEWKSNGFSQENRD